MDEGQLTRATVAAARRLSDTGAVAYADGGTCYCEYPGGLRAIVRNSLHPVPDFCEDRFVNQVSSEIVRAWLSTGGSSRRSDNQNRVAGAASE